MQTQYTPTLTQYQRDFEDGARKFWKGLSPIYCANQAELDGFWHAADEEAELWRQEREEQADRRQMMLGAW